MRLPEARGPMTQLLVERLAGPTRPSLLAAAVERAQAGHPQAHPLADEDLQLGLAICYELHYRGFEGVDERWEWEPSLLALRARLEARFERALRALAPPPAAPEAADIPAALRRLVTADDGPPLAAYVQRSATVEQFREFAVHRSVYQLKEADPHTWAIPRLTGRAKAALVEIQADEYGGGRVDAMHATLFARTLRELGLDDTYGAYLDRVPAVTLAAVNVISMFGLHRRLRGALVGHLAAYEMTSSLPNHRYGNGLRRLGFAERATRFYDEHVEADAVHEQVAAVDLCGSFAEAEPDRAGDVLWGASCALALDGRFAGHVLQAWQRGESSLRAPEQVQEVDLTTVASLAVPA
ncbi:MAG: iron-containing redox enzyme family protein [Actinomycetota bacterium]|nr:iron-containing redox enzyme family protein [Actinomycetota bacterium]